MPILSCGFRLGGGMMERLTNIGSNGEIWITDNDETRRLGRKESAYKKLAEYEDLEEQGLLLRLPCKVGDTVYRIWTCGKNGKSVAEFKIEHIDIDNYPQIEFSYRCTKGSHSFYQYRFCKLDDIGKTVFLTRSEAEESLARMKGE